MLLTFTLIIISIPSPPSLSHSMQALNIPFLQTLPTVAFIFFFRTDSADSLDHLPIHLDIPVFYFLAFLFELCLQCFDTVGWAAGRASGL